MPHNNVYYGLGLVLVCLAIALRSGPHRPITPRALTKEQVDPGGRVIKLHNRSHDRAYHEQAIQAVLLTEHQALEFLQLYFSKEAPDVVRYEPTFCKLRGQQVASRGTLWRECIYCLSYEFPNAAFSAHLIEGPPVATWARKVSGWLDRNKATTRLPFSERMDDLIFRWKAPLKTDKDVLAYIKTDVLTLRDWIWTGSANEAEQLYSISMDVKEKPLLPHKDSGEEWLALSEYVFEQGPCRVSGV